MRGTTPPTSGNRARIQHFLYSPWGKQVYNSHRKGQWAVTVSRMWRIVFRIEGGHVLDVDLTDYH